jgi:hypothetical protein
LPERECVDDEDEWFDFDFIRSDIFYPLLA